MHGGPLGDPEIFCVRVLGATGLSLTPLSPSLELLSQQGVSAGRFAMGVSVPSPGNGGPRDPRAGERRRGLSSGVWGCSGSVLLGQTWFFRGWHGVFSGRGFGVIRPFPCEDGEDGDGCCENVLRFGNELG